MSNKTLKLAALGVLIAFAVYRMRQASATKAQSASAGAAALAAAADF